jgi:hypothetical protein
MGKQSLLRTFLQCMCYGVLEGCREKHTQNHPRSN